MLLNYKLYLLFYTKIYHATTFINEDMLASDKTINDQDVTDLDQIFADQDVYDFDLKHDDINAYDYGAKFSEQSMFEFEDYFKPNQNDDISKRDSNMPQNENIPKYKKKLHSIIDESHEESISKQLKYEQSCNLFTKDNQNDISCISNVQYSIVPSNYISPDIEVSSGEEELANFGSNEFDEIIGNHLNPLKNTFISNEPTLNSGDTYAASNFEIVEAIYNVELDHNYHEKRHINSKNQCDRLDDKLNLDIFDNICLSFIDFTISIEDYLNILASKQNKFTKKTTLDDVTQRTNANNCAISSSGCANPIPNIYFDFVVSSNHVINEIEIMKVKSSTDTNSSKISKYYFRNCTDIIDSESFLNIENNINFMTASEINTNDKIISSENFAYESANENEPVASDNEDIMSSLLEPKNKENSNETVFIYYLNKITYKLNFVPINSITSILNNQKNPMSNFQNLYFQKESLTENDINSFLIRVKKDLVFAYRKIYDRNVDNESKIQQLTNNQNMIWRMYMEIDVGHLAKPCDNDQVMSNISSKSQNVEELTQNASISFELDFFVFVKISNPVIASNKLPSLLVNQNCISNDTQQIVGKEVIRELHSDVFAPNTFIINDEMNKNIISTINMLYTSENIQQIMCYSKKLDYDSFIEYLKNKKLTVKNATNLKYRYRINLDHLNYLNNDLKKLRGWFLLEHKDLVYLGRLQKHISIIIEQVKLLISKSVINYDIYFKIVKNETDKIIFDGNLRKHRERIFQYLKALLNDKDTNIFILLPGYPLLSECLNIKENLQYLNNDAEILNYLSFLHIFSLILKIEWSEIKFLTIEPKNHTDLKIEFLKTYNYIMIAYQVSQILLYLIMPYVKQLLFLQILLFMEIEMVMYDVYLNKNTNRTTKKNIFEFKLRRYSFISKCVMTNEIFIHNIISLRSPKSRDNPLIQYYASSYDEKSFYANITFSGRVQDVVILLNYYYINLCMYKLSITLKKILVSNIYEFSDLDNWQQNSLNSHLLKEFLNIERHKHESSMNLNIVKHFKTMDIIDKFIFLHIIEPTKYIEISKYLIKIYGMDI
ncbi:hypothetical protein COBT_001640, partial [Conglomerata obtusa]